MTAKVRDGRPDDYVTLSEGVTHYELAGPGEGPPVVLIHGFSVPLFVWDPTFEALREAGHRVLRYDLFGRGASERPRGRYDLARFERQLVELVTALDLGPRVDLVGLSMGGAIAVGVTDRHPDLVRRLVLIDPAGLFASLPWALRLVRVPWVGEVVVALLGRWILIASLEADIHRPGEMAALLGRYREPYLAQTRRWSFFRALLSTVRHGPLSGLDDAYARVGEQARRPLLIWGREDRTVPFALSERARTLLPDAEFHAIDGAGHAPHLERPGVVNKLMIEYLNEGR